MIGKIRWDVIGTVLSIEHTISENNTLSIDTEKTGVTDRVMNDGLFNLFRVFGYKNWALNNNIITLSKVS